MACGQGGSALAAVDKAVFADPQHHRRQSLTDLLDRMDRDMSALGLEARLAGRVFTHSRAKRPD
jgi:hypothetical protein